MDKSSVEAFGSLDPLLDLLFFLLPLPVVHNLTEQLVHDSLNRKAGLLFCKVHCVFVVCLVIAEVVGRDNVIEGIFRLRSQNQPVDAIDDLSEGQGGAVVSVEDGVANSTLRVHVAVIDRSDKPNFRSFEWIVSRELGVKQEKSVLVGSFFGAEEEDFPEIDVGAREDSHKGVRIVTISLNLFGYSFQTSVSRDLLRFLGSLHLFEHLFGRQSSAFTLRHIEFMNIVGEVEGLEFGDFYFFGKGKFDQIHIQFPCPHTQHCFLLEEFETFFQISGQVAPSSRGLRNDLQSFAVGSNRERIDYYVILNNQSGGFFNRVFGTCIFSVSQSQYSHNTVWILQLKFFQRIGRLDHCIVHQSRSSRLGPGHQAVEVIDGFSEAALVLNQVVEEEEGDHVLEVVGDCSVGKGFEE